MASAQRSCFRASAAPTLSPNSRSPQSVQPSRAVMHRSQQLRLRVPVDHQNRTSASPTPAKENQCTQIRSFRTLWESRRFKSGGNRFRARKWPCKPTKIAPLSAMALLLERPQKSRSNFRVNSSHYGHSGLPPLGTTWASGSLFNGRNTSIHGCVLVGGLVMLPYCSLFRLGELHLSGRSILFVHRTGVRLPI